MTESVTPRVDPPLVDPETRETPPLSAQRQFLAHEERVKRLVERGIRPAPMLVPAEFLKVSEAQYKAFLEGSWDSTEPDDAA
jgi:hypothetical protein